MLILLHPSSFLFLLLIYLFRAMQFFMSLLYWPMWHVFFKKIYLKYIASTDVTLLIIISLKLTLWPSLTLLGAHPTSKWMNRLFWLTENEQSITWTRWIRYLNHSLPFSFSLFFSFLGSKHWIIHQNIISLKHLREVLVTDGINTKFFLLGSHNLPNLKSYFQICMVLWWTCHWAGYELWQFKNAYFLVNGGCIYLFINSNQFSFNVLVFVDIHS